MPFFLDSDDPNFVPIDVNKKTQMVFDESISQETFENMDPSAQSTTSSDKNKQVLF